MLALPLFESGGCCVGVLEIIMTSQKINYAPYVDLLYKALEAMDLRSSEIFNLPCARVLDQNQEITISEILEVLTVLCETYRLPLAQTWMLCRHGHFSTHVRSLPPSNSFNRNYIDKSCKNLRIVYHKELGEERDIKTINSPLEEKLVLGSEFYEISQNIRSLETLKSIDMPEASQTGKQKVKANSREEQKMLELDAVDCERKTVKGLGNVSVSVPDKWTLEVIQKLYGRSLQDAAECLGDHQQPEMLLESFANEKSSTGEEDVRDPSKALRSPNLAVNQEKAVTNVATAPCERALSISARYQHKTMKFPLTKTGLEQKLAEMLRLKLGTFMIKYLDTENDWILIACDGDLKDLTVVACDGTIHMIDCPSKSIICKNSSEFDA